MNVRRLSLLSPLALVLLFPLVYLVLRPPAPAARADDKADLDRRQDELDQRIERLTGVVERLSRANGEALAELQRLRKELAEARERTAALARTTEGLAQANKSILDQMGMLHRRLGALAPRELHILKKVEPLLLPPAKMGGLR
jgi:chromosome segregation ATPase